MNFLKRLFGLEAKTSKINDNSLLQEKSNVVDLSDTGHRKIYPVLMSEHTSEFDLTNELVDIFHRREGIFSKQLLAHVWIDEHESVAGKEPTVHLFNTSGKNREDYGILRDKGLSNLDHFNLPFEDWNVVDNALDFKIISCPVSAFSSEMILSKKHMDDAHRELDCDELLVSIPRRGLIFICANNLSEENCNHFINLHSRIVCLENKNLELLCEDIFVVKNGEITEVLGLNPLSDILRGQVA